MAVLPWSHLASLHFLKLCFTSPARVTSPTPAAAQNCSRCSHLLQQEAGVRFPSSLTWKAGAWEGVCLPEALVGAG